MSKEDALLSFGDLIDKLSIENIKCYDANNKVINLRREMTKRGPTPSDYELIAKWEWQARSSGEMRVKLRHEINLRLKDAVNRGDIEVLGEARTYDL